MLRDNSIYDNKVEGIILFCRIYRGKGVVSAMTAILTYIGKDFSIILSDNRINFGPNQEGGYEDGTTKLVDLNYMGWASGAGLSDYLDDLKRSLVRIKPSSPDDIKNIYTRVLESHHKNDPDYIEDINKSVVVASWLGFNADTSSVLLRIGSVCKEHFDDKVMFLPEGIIYVVYPGDYVDDLSKVDELKDKFDFEVTGDIGEVISKMLEIFEEISKNSIYVSQHCDIGTMNVVDNNKFWNVYKHKISGNVTKLINSYKTGNFEKEIEVVSASKIPKNAWSRR